jgi:hypothetical protein
MIKEMKSCIQAMITGEVEQDLNTHIGEYFPNIIGVPAYWKGVHEADRPAAISSAVYHRSGSKTKIKSERMKLCGTIFSVSGERGI